MSILNRALLYFFILSVPVSSYAGWGIPWDGLKRWIPVIGSGDTPASKPKASKSRSTKSKASTPPASARESSSSTSSPKTSSKVEFDRGGQGVPRSGGIQNLNRATSSLNALRAWDSQNLHYLNEGAKAKNSATSLIGEIGSALASGSWRVAQGLVHVAKMSIEATRSARDEVEKVNNSKYLRRQDAVDMANETVRKAEALLPEIENLNEKAGLQSMIEESAVRSRKCADVYAQQDVMNAKIKRQVDIRTKLEGTGAGRALTAVCFPGETPVSVKNDSSENNSSVPIESIRKGDLVLSCDVESNTCNYRQVTQLITNTADRLIRLSANGQTIKATGNHPFYVTDRMEWVEAQDLQRGDQLLTITGDRVSIDDIELEEGDFTVYNLEVDENHNYFAGGVLVHNCNLSVAGAKYGEGSIVASATSAAAGASIAGAGLLISVAGLGPDIAKSAWRTASYLGSAVYGAAAYSCSTIYNGVANVFSEPNQSTPGDSTEKSDNESKPDKQKKGTPGNNQEQNRQFADATKGLTKDQKRRVHDEISGMNFGYKEIKEVVKGMFGK